MSAGNSWAGLAARLGTSPKQLALLLLSAAAAIGIFGAKILMTPKSAEAAAPTPAPSTTPAPAAGAPSATPTPGEFLGPMPRWNLAKKPTRSPFATPVDFRAASGTSGAALANSTAINAGLTLQATLDGRYAVVDGKTLTVGQSYVDDKTGQRFQLTSVGHRTVTFSCGTQVSDLSIDIPLSKEPR